MFSSYYTLRGFFFTLQLGYSRCINIPTTPQKQLNERWTVNASTILARDRPLYRLASAFLFTFTTALYDPTNIPFSQLQLCIQSRLCFFYISIHSIAPSSSPYTFHNLSVILSQLFDPQNTASTSTSTTSKAKLKGEESLYSISW